MKITEHIHALKLPFQIESAAGKKVDRFVYAYLIYGTELCLIDAGVLSSDKVIIDYIKETGRDPEEISLLIQTHSHPDHIGGSKAIQNASGCKIAAHRDAVPWIEDVELQSRTRPSPYFFSLVKESLKVDRVLRDGDRVELSDGQVLQVIHTPGHSKGSLSLLLEQEGALFSGDAIPAAGEYPIYEDVLGTVRSIKKLRDIRGLKFLLSAWADPQYGDAVYQAMEAALGHMQHIHEAVRQARATSPAGIPGELSAQILKDLGFPVTPNGAKSIEAHLEVVEHPDLARE
jgi:hydroxyacylglutathione hydrolase